MRGRAAVPERLRGVLRDADAAAQPGSSRLCGRQFAASAAPLSCRCRRPGTQANTQIAEDLLQPAELLVTPFEMLQENVSELRRRCRIGHHRQCIDELFFGVVKVFEVALEQLSKCFLFHFGSLLL